MFRATRLTPAGWMRLSREARRGDISVPSKPMIRSWPIAWPVAKLLLLGIVFEDSLMARPYNSNLNAQESKPAPCNSIGTTTPCRELQTRTLDSRGAKLASTEDRKLGSRQKLLASTLCQRN